MVPGAAERFLEDRHLRGGLRNRTSRSLGTSQDVGGSDLDRGDTCKGPQTRGPGGRAGLNALRCNLEKEPALGSDERLGGRGLDPDCKACCGLVVGS